MAALCIAGTSGTFAQPAPPAVYNWTGFYAGLNGGFGGGTVKPTLNSSSAAAANGFPGSTDTDAQSHRLGGFLAGGQVGYNYQLRNNVVWGIESDLQWSDVRALDRRDVMTSLNANTAFPGNDLATTHTTIRQNWFGTTRLRLGYSFADRLLAYVTGGGAYSEFTAGNSGIGTTLTPPLMVYSNTSGAATSTRIGWTAGAGFEYALGNNFSLKTEYLFSQYAGFAAPYLNTAQSTPATTNGTFSTGTLGIHQVRAGLNYRLGASEAPDTRMARAAPTLFNWTGFYAGVNGGYGGGIVNSGRSDSALYLLPFFPASVNTTNVGQTMRAGGGAIGGQIGYNKQFENRFLVGIESDLQWSGIKASSRSNSSGAYNASIYAYSASTNTSIEQNWFGTTRLRLGYRPTDRLMAYATAGVAYAGFSADYSGASSDNGGGNSVTTTAGSRGPTRIGWTAGAGAEYAIADHVSFKTEYLYSEYAGFAVPYQAAMVTGFSSSTTQGTFSTGTLGLHLVRAGLNFKLGGGSP